MTSVEQELSAITRDDQQKMEGGNDIDDNGTVMPGALPEDKDDAIDDFDDFAEEQEEMADDEFGDFDDGFQEPEEIVEAETMDEGTSTPAPQPPTPSVVSIYTMIPSIPILIHDNSHYS